MPAIDDLCEQAYPYKKQDENVCPERRRGRALLYLDLLMPVRPPRFRPSHAQASRPSAKQEHDRRRGSARERGYTAEWDRASKSFIAQHPICLGCEAVGWVDATAVVDHVEPHRGDMVKFWNADMWQPCCRWHHDVVKQRLEARFDEGRLSIADLWLNSRAAQALTLDLAPDRAAFGRA